MTGKRRQYLLVWLILLACSLLPISGKQLASAAPPLPPGLTAVTQPAPMPTFHLPTPKGSPMRSADLRGKVVVIRFWATW